MLFVIALMLMSVLAHAKETVSYNFTYDANGNLIQDNQFYYEYNNFNQLKRVREGNASGTVIEEYMYDHEGNRILKKNFVINETTFYISENFIRVSNSSGVFDTVYYYDEKDLVARKDPDGKKFFYHPDHLGSTTLITNESGDVVEEVTYEPFGKLIEDSDERYLYTGKELDRSTDLQYYGARYYSPELGRFVEPDSNLPNVYDPQQLNRYSYVRNNPLKYTDPYGNDFGLVSIPVATFIVITSAAVVTPIVADLSTAASKQLSTMIGTFLNAPNAGSANPVSPLTSGSMGIPLKPTTVGPDIRSDLNPSLNPLGQIGKISWWDQTTGLENRGNAQFDTSTLNTKYEKHKNEFPAMSKEEFKQRGENLLGRTSGSEVEEYLRPNGELVRINKNTGEFGIRRPDGTVKTFYKPSPRGGKSSPGYAYDYFLKDKARWTRGP